jgi:hypothetical protein
MKLIHLGVMYSRSIGEEPVTIGLSMKKKRVHTPSRPGARASG